VLATVHHSFLSRGLRPILRVCGPMLAGRPAGLSAPVGAAPGWRIRVS
jgi:hypothetical protein